MVRERELVEWIAARAPDAGDDCAVLDCAPWGTLLVTVDAVIDGVHARWGVEGPGAFGYKAVARGLSDVAAMAGEPLWAVVAATLPEAVTLAEAQALYRGAERAGCRLVGGDTATGPVASVTATVLGRAGPGGPVLRSGARPGDRLIVSGPLGGAVASGKHATFTPRVAEAQALAAACEVAAMIDLSDGLSTDLLHVLAASGCGARIEAARLPAASVAAALHDGEDYELLAAVRAGTPPAGWTEIGAVTERDAVLVGADGRETPLARGGSSMAREVLSRSDAETRAAGEAFGATLSPGDVVLLDGELGAGKTTFTKGIARACGVQQLVRSPTFALMHRYHGDPDVVHIDLYRQGEDAAFDDLGLDEDGDAVIVVEWPRTGARERWPGARVVTLEHVDETTRRITLP